MAPVAGFDRQGAAAQLVAQDAQRTGVGAVQDWGYVLLLAWPVVISWYAFKTRGRKGWRLTAGLLGLIWSANIGWMFGGVRCVVFRGGRLTAFAADGGWRECEPSRLKGRRLDAVISVQLIGRETMERSHDDR